MLVKEAPDDKPLSGQMVTQHIDTYMVMKELLDIRGLWYQM